MRKLLRPNKKKCEIISVKWTSEMNEKKLKK